MAAPNQVKSNLGPTDGKSKGQVELKKGVYSIMLITEAGNAILLNEDVYDFYFIEDIFKYSMVGKLIFNDRYNFFENGPFTGQEKIALIYGKGESDKNMIFDIWKIGRISQAGPGIRETSEQMIELYFVDPYYAALSLRRYSRSWSDEKYSTIMRDIINNMMFAKDTGFDIILEESSNKTDFYIPYWTPRTSLSWLCKRAKGARSGTSGYLVFNNTLNGFTTNVVTMNYLLADVGKTVDKKPYRLQSDIVSDENKILEWWISGLDRTSNQTLRGGYWRGHDFLTKSFLQVGYNYSDASKINMMLGRKTLYQRIDDLNCANWTPGDSDIETLADVAFNDWSKRYNMQFIVNLVVEGDEKRFAGQHIEVEWPGLKGSEKMNDALKGKYMIKSVTHSFKAGKTYPYTQRLVCIKNAYHNSKSVMLHDSDVTNLYSEGKQANILRS
jgi:hypothetical protein